MKSFHSSYRFGFIGIGRMAEVILRGMLRAEICRPEEVLVSSTNSAALKKIQRELKVHVTMDNREVASRSKFLWIGVKPFQSEQVLSQIAPDMAKDSMVISMMAGVSLSFLKAYLGSKPALVRIMPNTPCLVGAGMTGVYFPKSSPAPRRKILLEILKSLGEVHLCEREIDLDAVTGLSGSGVAFVYEAAQGLIEGGIASGLTPAASRQVAIQTLLGAGEMLKHSVLAPSQLVEQVVSKKGTTEAGLKVLRKKHWLSVLAQAVQKASDRARQIREEKNRCLP